MPEAQFEISMVDPQEALTSSDLRLVDVVDSLLYHGLVIRGEIWLSVAGVDLVFLGADLVLANPDTIRRTEPVN